MAKPPSTEAFRVSEQLMSVAQVAGWWGMSEATVREYIKDGRLPAVHFGGSVGYRIKRTDAQRFLDALEDATRVAAELKRAAS